MRQKTTLSAYSSETYFEIFLESKIKNNNKKTVKQFRLEIWQNYVVICKTPCLLSITIHITDVLI